MLDLKLLSNYISTLFKSSLCAKYCWLYLMDKFPKPQKAKYFVSQYH